MTHRVFNFSAGPAALPQAVLEQAAAEMLDWHGSGMSVMEMSHRGKEFVSIAAQAEADLRELMNIPDNYKVLFLQGGASGQFSAIPLNLTDGDSIVDYVVTGSWGKKAVKEAKKHVANVNVVAQPESFTTVPCQTDWQLSDNAAYVHITPNETIEGVEYPFLPETKAPLIADMSSTILSRPIDVTKYGVIYAGAQKNIGPAGVTIVIIRDDLIGNARDNCPMIMDWQQQADADSMLNTPSCYAWYICGLVFKHLKAQGGLTAMAEINQRKADKLYAAIDNSAFYANPVDPACRSWMNVPFTLANAELDAAFLSEAKAAGLVTLKGHRSVGGMRASIYNAMPEEGVDALIAFMADFEKCNG